MAKLNKLGVENSLWNNIRANKGSGKAPTKEMLKQERKINAKYADGGIIGKYPEGGDVFSNPELANSLPDNSPVRIGNKDLYKNYKPVVSPYTYQEPSTNVPSAKEEKEIKKAIKKEEKTIENMSPVKKAMITNPVKAQTFQPLAVDAQAVYEEKKKNPDWKNFKGNYSIYSKENSMLHLFDNKHNLLDQTRAGRGVGKGDTPNLANPKDWYDSNKPKKGQERAIKNATTPAGSYAIKENPMNYNNYGTKTYSFGDVNKYNAQAAMHGIYKGDTYNRTKIINDPNIKQAYVSNGCLNIPVPFLNKNDSQINSGDSLFVTKEPKFANGGRVLPKFGNGGTTETPKKPLVNWFNRTKEFEYGQVLDKKGNPIIDKKTGNFLKTSKKIVDIPDSILGGYGGKKTVTNTERIEKTGGGRKNISIPIPTLAPMLLGALAANKISQNTPELNKNASVGDYVTSIGGTFLPALAGFAGTSLLLDRGIKKGGLSFWNAKNSAGFLPNAIASTVTGIPYMEKIGSYKTKGKENIVTDTEKSFDSNAPVPKIKNVRTLANGGRVLPRFYDGGGVRLTGSSTFNSAMKAPAGTVTKTASGKAPSNFGDNVVTGAGIASAAVPILTSFIPDEQVTDSEGNVLGSKVNLGKGILNSAAQGASMGMAAGPWGAAIGAGLGAGVGAVTTLSGNNALDESKRIANIGIGNKNLSTAMTSNKNTYSINDYNNSVQVSANGGTIVNQDMGNPNAELELNETFRDPMTGETGMVDGPSHDNGGIEMNLAEGTQIWSDRLKHNGRTFASLTKPIINQIANLEKGLDTNPNSRFKQNTIKLLNSQLDFFFDIQESNKQQDEMKRTLKKQEGGVVDDMGNYHYTNGGIYIKPENKGKFTAWANSHDMGVQEAARHVMANKEDYSSTTVKRANFAKNAAGWKHADGGKVPYNNAPIEEFNKKYGTDYVSPGDMSNYKYPNTEQFIDSDKKKLMDMYNNHAILQERFKNAGMAPLANMHDKKGYDLMKRTNRSINSIPIESMMQKDSLVYAMGGMVQYDGGGTKDNYLLPDGSYNKRQFMLDQLNPNMTQYKTFDPAMSNYKVNQNAELAKEKNSLGAEMDQINIASRGNAPRTMGPMNRPQGYQEPIANQMGPMNRPAGYVDPIQPMQTVENMPAGYDPNAALKRSIKPYYNNADNNYDAMPPAEQQYNFQMSRTGNTNLPATGAGPGGVNPALFNKANYSNGDYYMNHPTPGGGSSADVTAAYEKQRSLDAASQNPNAGQGYVRNNKGELIQTGALVSSTLAQLNNKIPPPANTPDVRLTGAIPNPRYVDLSAERGAINRSALGAMEGAQRGFGSSASAQAFKNKARINQLQGLGQSFSNQEIANADIGNKFAGMRGDAAIKEAIMNSQINTQNNENRYGFNLNRMANQNAAYATLGKGLGDIGRNRTNQFNEMERLGSISNRYDKSVYASSIRDNPERLKQGIDAGMYTIDELQKWGIPYTPQAKYGGTFKKGTIKTRSLKY